MKVVLGWLKDPLIHVILLGLALVYGITGSQGEETRQVLAQPATSLGEEDEVIEDMSPPIVATAGEIVRQN